MIFQLAVTLFFLLSNVRMECTGSILEVDELHLYSQVQTLDISSTLVHCDQSIHICFIYSSIDLTLNLYDFFRFEIIQRVPIEEKYVKQIHLIRHQEQFFIVLESKRNKLLIFTFDNSVKDVSPLQNLNEKDLHVSQQNNNKNPVAAATSSRQGNLAYKVENNARNIRGNKQSEKSFIYLNLLIENQVSQDKKEFHLVKIGVNLNESNQKVLNGQDEDSNQQMNQYHEEDIHTFLIKPSESCHYFLNCSLSDDQQYLVCVDNSLKVGFLELKILDSPVFQKQKNSVTEIHTLNYHKLFQANKLAATFQLQSIVLKNQQSLSIILIFESTQKNELVFDQLVIKPEQETVASFNRHVVQSMDEDILISKLHLNQTSQKQSSIQLKNCLLDVNETQFSENSLNKTNVNQSLKNFSQILFSKTDSNQIKGFFLSDGNKIQFYVKACLYQDESFFFSIYDCQKNYECKEKRTFNNQEICLTEKSKNSGSFQIKKQQLKLIKRINICYQTSLNLEEFIEQNKSKIALLVIILLCGGCLCQENIQQCIKSYKDKYFPNQSDSSQQNANLGSQGKNTSIKDIDQEIEIENDQEQTQNLVIQHRQFTNQSSMLNSSQSMENYSLQDLQKERSKRVNKLIISQDNYPTLAQRPAQMNEIINYGLIQQKNEEKRAAQCSQDDQEEEKQQCYNQFKDIQEFQYNQEYYIDQFRYIQKNNQILKTFQIPAFEIENDNKNHQNNYLRRLKNSNQNQFKCVKNINTDFHQDFTFQNNAQLNSHKSDSQMGQFCYPNVSQLTTNNKDSNQFDSETFRLGFNQEEGNNYKQQGEKIFSSSLKERGFSFQNESEYPIQQQNIKNKMDYFFSNQLSQGMFYKNNFGINQFQNQGNQVFDQQHQNNQNQIQFDDKEFIVPSDQSINFPCNFKQQNNIYCQDFQDQFNQQNCKATKQYNQKTQEFISYQSSELNLLQKYNSSRSTQTNSSSENSIQPSRNQEESVVVNSYAKRTVLGDGEAGNQIQKKEKRNVNFNSTIKQSGFGQKQLCRKSNLMLKNYRLQFQNIQDEKATKKKQKNKKFNQWNTNQCGLHSYSPHSYKQFKKCYQQQFRQQELDWFTQSTFYSQSPHVISAIQKKPNSQNQKFSYYNPQQQIQKINQQKCSICLQAHNIKIYNQLNHDQKKQNLQKSQFFFDCKNHCNSQPLSTHSINKYKSASCSLKNTNQTELKLLKNQVESSYISNNIYQYQSQSSPPLPPSQLKPNSNDKQLMFHLTFQQQSVNFEEEILNQMELSGSASSQSNTSILASDFQSQRFMDNFQEQMGDSVNQESKYDPFFYTSETNDKSFFSSSSNEFGDTVKKIRHINNDLKQQEIFDIKDFQFISENLFEESQEIKKQKNMNHVLLNNNLNFPSIFDKNNQIENLSKMTQQINDHFLLSVNNLLNESKNI